jgi:hypothetical protein
VKALRSARGLAVRARAAAIVARHRKHARDRFAAAQRERERARADYEAWAHDRSYERWRRAEIEHDDALAEAQEWCIGEGHGVEACW